MGRKDLPMGVYRSIQTVTKSGGPTGRGYHYNRGAVGISGVATRSQRKTTGISDILSRLQAFSRFMAVLLVSDSTTREVAAGLAAHKHLFLQLAKDLGGRQWLKYDWDFREWTAAKNIRIWDDLNMSIYERCLPQLWSSAGPSMLNPGASGKNQSPVCFKWNVQRSMQPTPLQLYSCMLGLRRATRVN